MKSHNLARFVAPPPPPAPKCQAPQCEMAPEVIVPLGDGALELCWLCAHHHVDHGVPLSECATSERCEHTPDEIYPRLQVIVDDETRPVLECAKRAAAEVAAWPAWKRGEPPPSTPVKPAWCRGRGADRGPRARRTK